MLFFWLFPFFLFTNRDWGAKVDTSGDPTSLGGAFNLWWFAARLRSCPSRWRWGVDAWRDPKLIQSGWKATNDPWHHDMFFLLYESIVGNVGHALKGLHLRPSIDAARLHSTKMLSSCLVLSQGDHGRQSGHQLRQGRGQAFLCLHQQRRGHKRNQLQNASKSAINLQLIYKVHQNDS